MQKTNIYCGNCGFENPIENNYCFNCGKKLIKFEKITQTNPAQPKMDEHSEIKKAFEKLLKNNGYLSVSIGDYYIQFTNDNKIANNLGQDELIFEAVSGEFIPEVLNSDQAFKSLNFTIEKGSNYYKFLKLSEINIDNLIGEIEYIFNDLYLKEFKNYKIEIEIEGNIKKSTNNKTKTKTKNNGCLIVIIIAVIIGFFSIISNNDNYSENSKTKEIVYNSEYDASVYQVERYLKQKYLKDPDSYQSIEWSPVQLNENNPNYKYIVRHSFRAKNSFGGYVVENKVFFLSKTGDIVDYVDF